VSGSGKFDQVFVSNLILCEQNKMMIDIASSAAGFLFQAAARGDINLASDNRFDAFLTSGLVEINRSEQHPVIGYRHRWKL